MKTTTTSKAKAAGFAAPIGALVSALLSMVPGWDRLPPDVATAILVLVGTVINVAVVYWAPPNQPESRYD